MQANRRGAIVGLLFLGLILTGSFTALVARHVELKRLGGTEIGAKAPMVLLNDWRGRPASLAQLTGHVIVAYVCQFNDHACEQADPYFAQLAKTWVGDDRVRFVRIYQPAANQSIDELCQAVRVEQRVAQHPFATLIGRQQAMLPLLGQCTLPQILVLDAVGRVSFRGLPGQGTREAELEDDLCRQSLAGLLGQPAIAAGEVAALTQAVGASTMRGR